MVLVFLDGIWYSMNHKNRDETDENIVREHLLLYRQMIFLSGPRQVGKTTLAKQFATDYLNWETKDVRQLILKGAKAVGDSLGLDSAVQGKRTVVFDEIHRYSKWKGFLKAVEGWTDLGFGEFDLFYLRDKKKREVDFLVTRDKVPWFVAEVKNADAKLSPALAYFQGLTGAKHAFHVVMERRSFPSFCNAGQCLCLRMPM